jgi:3-dehydroquinate synthetase
VLASIDTLVTLPESELRNGMAEVVKHGVISDQRLFEECMDGIPKDWKAMMKLVSRGMKVKIDIIQCDPYERGLRESLNFGHTIGHAIETLSQYEIPHGEAVSMGMVSEARISRKLGLAEEGLEERLRDVLQKIGLPIAIPQRLDRSKILEVILHDKKRVGGASRFSLPVSIGEVQYGVEVPLEDVATCVE